ncbi:MAG TPA: beta-propeller fold lactonase family protein [Polyangiaceae bacterium]
MTGPVATPPATRTSAPLRLAPGQRAAHASLFGTDAIGLSDGSTLTPDAAPGSKLLELDPHVAGYPQLRAMGAVALASDGRRLALLTSGYNRTFDASGERVELASREHVFLYDLPDAGPPVERTVVSLPDSFGGLAFGPDGRLYVSAGPDDEVHVFGDAVEGKPLALGHLQHGSHLGGIGRSEGPFAAGVAIAAGRLVVADHENDAITLVDLSAPERAPTDLPVCEFPYAVAAIGSHAFVTCLRSRELVDVDLGAPPLVVRHIPVGAQPTAVVASRSGAHLYVANAGSDTVSIVDVASGREVATVPTMAPPGALPPQVTPLRGSSPNGLALSPDERTLYVTNGGNSTLAVVALDASGGAGQVAGLVPTGLYPTAVAVSPSGRWLYVAHAKSPTGPNPRGPWTDSGLSAMHPYAEQGGNEYAFQLHRGGLLALPVPDAPTLAKLTAQAIANDFPEDVAQAPPALEALRGVISHVVLVVAENRTYDQVLGDLAGADGDARLVHWGEAITPNQHAVARRFVTLDRFFASGDVSGDGWQWTMGARTTDVAEKVIPLYYGSRGHHTYDWEGRNRGVNVGLADDDERVAFDPTTPLGVLPGAVDVAAPDAFLWDAAIAAGKSVRAYGVFCDLERYGLAESDPARLPLLHMPFETRTRVAFPTRASLMAIEDPYFRAFDQRFPDAWREAEYERELAGYVAGGEMPALSIVRLPHDHLGAFGDAIDGVDTPDTQMADHDWAVGRLVEALSRTRFWESTVVFVVEDDAQNGSDHVDSHRTIALVAGGHVRRHAVVHTPYTTTSLLRTIELLLGLAPLSQHDAEAEPMTDVFDATADTTPFAAVVPSVLRSTKLPLPPPFPGEHATAPRRNAAWWAAATAGFDFDDTDAAPADAMNRVLREGLFSR